VTLDPRSAAQYAIVAVCLVLVGAALVAPLAVEQRATVLSAAIVVLSVVAWRSGRREG